MARTYFLEAAAGDQFFVYTNKGGARGKREYVKSACGSFNRKFSAFGAVEFATKQGGAVKLGAAVAVEHPC